MLYIYLLPAVSSFFVTNIFLGAPSPTPSAYVITSMWEIRLQIHTQQTRVLRAKIRKNRSNRSNLEAGGHTDAIVMSKAYPFPFSKER